ncbi:MAG: adenine deaminase [Dehalococcoidales bacterium]|nr:adenine deaminase [Dehalococcoidales bacterium]
MSEKTSGMMKRYKLARVALGEEEADLAIVNGKIVNVYTAEVLTGQTILIKGERIAYAGPYATHRGVGKNTRVIDAAGKVLIPGLIDGHTHFDYLVSTAELVRFAMQSGTTSIITETVEIAFRLGYSGIKEYLNSLRRQPVKFWFTLPPMTTISPVSAGHNMTSREIKQLLKRPDCLGLGEIYWGPVNAGSRRELRLIEATLGAGKKIEGHSAGAARNKLQAYSSMGITSDHEPITAEEALERLRLGLSVMIREGEVRQDLEAVSPVKDYSIDFRRLALSSDGVGPVQLTRLGFMDHLVQKAIDLGFPPVRAIQMGSLNVAEHFNLQDVIGGIAPGRYADILMIPEIDIIKPDMVISSGKVVKQEGNVTGVPRRHEYPASVRNCVRLRKEFTAADFSVPCGISAPAVKVRVIDQLTGILTRASLLELEVKDGQIEMDPSRDILKVAAVEYVYTPGKTFTGFIHGLGLKKGAVATSTCWDSADLVAAGANESDMARAVNRIRELQGGVAVCLDGEVLAEASFPIASVISDEPMEILADKLESIQRSFRDMGGILDDIRTTLSVLPTPAIPYLRLCESGLFDVRANHPVDLIADGV